MITSKPAGYALSWKVRLAYDLRYEVAQRLLQKMLPIKTYIEQCVRRWNFLKAKKMCTNRFTAKIHSAKHPTVKCSTKACQQQIFYGENFCTSWCNAAVYMKKGLLTNPTNSFMAPVNLLQRDTNCSCINLICNKISWNLISFLEYMKVVFLSSPRTPISLLVLYHTIIWFSFVLTS